VNAWVLAAALAFAQVPDGPSVGEGMIVGLPPGPPPPADQVDDIAHRIATHLRCPVCQALSVAASSSEAAVMFQRRIKELVAAGYTEEQIDDYFVDRYGDWILLDPPAEGMQWILWIVPGLLGGVGLTWAAGTATQWRREPDEAPLPSDVGLTEMDDYEKALLAELEDN
jgi:cytochrome c-type biogenesis protein CcmH